MRSKSPFDADPEEAASGPQALAPVIRLRPIRTLVVSSDLAYHERATSVLSAVGSVQFAVTALAAADEVAALVARERPDVVLLDATDCESDARQVIAALAEVAPRTGVVVVCHHCTQGARELDALPKWGWTQDLRAGVEVAYREGNPLCPGAYGALRRRSPWRRMAGPLKRR